MKVLLIAPLPPAVGGVASVADNLINGLKRYPGGIELLVYNNVHRFRSVTTQSFFVRVVTGIFNALKTWWRVRQIIRKDMPDLIHLTSSASLALFKDFLIIHAAGRVHIPVVMHWHFGRIPELRIYLAETNASWMPALTAWHMPKSSPLMIRSLAPAG